MAEFTPRRWNPRAAAATLAVALCALLPLPGSAQAPAEPTLYYCNSRSFRIPFRINPEDRVKLVRLWVLDETGKQWNPAGTADPSRDVNFSFQATRDGTYSFAVQSEGQDGKRTPVGDQTNPLMVSIRICVDTERPVVHYFRPSTPRDGTVAVEWDIEDANLNPLSLQVDYRPLGSRDEREWRAVNVPALPRGDQSWTPGVSGPLEVRLYVKDRAGNDTMASTSVTPGSTKAPGTDDGRAQVRYVRNRRVQMRYNLDNVGDSGVQAVEVWVTRDMQRWVKARSIDKKDLQVKGDSSHPAEEQTLILDLDSAGRWGVTIIPRSGVGLAEPAPRTGDPPQLWLEVVESNPAVTIRDVLVGQQGPDLGRVTVYWTASGKFLKQNAISILYGDSPTGPWTPLKKDLENNGSYQFERDNRDGKTKLPYQFYLRVEAVDEAGNIGYAVTRDPVKVDTQIPRARIKIDVDAAPPPADPLRP
jgi:hypothetical protein